MPTSSIRFQRGFSIVELIVAIVVVAILATAFLSAFSSVLKTSASPGQIAVMESLAASQMERVLSGGFQSAVAASSTTPITLSVDGNTYQAYFSGASSVIGGAPVTNGVHLTVTINADTCVSCVSLAGDSFDVQ